MRKISTLVIIVIIFSSCNYFPKHKEEANHLVDSISKSNRKKELFIREQEKIAYGEINFGIDAKQFQNFKKKISGKERWTKIGQFNYSLGAYYLKNEDPYSSFTGDSLYEIMMVGSIIDFENYNFTLKDEWENLHNIIFEKYGTGLIEMGFPPIYKLENRKMFIIDKWVIGSKEIKLGIRYTIIHDGSSKYQIECYITNTKMRDQLIDSTRDSIDKINRNASKQF